MTNQPEISSSAVSHAIDVMRSEPSKRELYYAAIAAVQDPKNQGIDRFALEEIMAGVPEAATMYQPMGVLVDTLVKVGAIDEVTPEPEYDELTQDSYVDATKIRYIPNAATGQILDQVDPARRFSQLLEANGEYRAAYAQLLDFCQVKPRTRQEIDELLNGVCEQAPNPGNRAKQGLYPSFFTDGLQKVGALAWKDGWTITEVGKACLAICR